MWVFKPCIFSRCLKWRVSSSVRRSRWAFPQLPLLGRCYWKDSLTLRNFLLWTLPGFLGRTEKLGSKQRRVQMGPVFLVPLLRHWLWVQSFLTDCHSLNLFAEHILWEATTESRRHSVKILYPFPFALSRDTSDLSVTISDCFGLLHNISNSEKTFGRWRNLQNLLRSYHSFCSMCPNHGRPPAKTGLIQKHKNQRCQMSFWKTFWNMCAGCGGKETQRHCLGVVDTFEQQAWGQHRGRQSGQDLGATLRTKWSALWGRGWTHIILTKFIADNNHYHLTYWKAKMANAVPPSKSSGRNLLKNK